MPYRRKYVLCLFLLLALQVFGACGQKRNIENVVVDNQDIFKAEAEDVIARYQEDPDAFREEITVEELQGDSLAILKDTRQWGENACIYRPAEYGDDTVLVCTCSATGLLMATFEWGFYYTQEDTVHLLRNAYVSGELTEGEDGIYRCMEEGGDNYYNTKKICEHFYYYETGN